MLIIQATIYQPRSTNADDVDLTSCKKILEEPNYLTSA